MSSIISSYKCHFNPPFAFSLVNFIFLRMSVKQVNSLFMTSIKRERLFIIVSFVSITTILTETIFDGFPGKTHAHMMAL